MSQPDYQNFLLQAERAEERGLYRADAERTLLICILRKPELIEHARKSVTPEMMTQTDHQYLYKIMLYVYEHLVLQQAAPLSFDTVTMCLFADRCGPEYSKKFRESPYGLRFLDGLLRSANMVNPAEVDKYIFLVREAHSAVTSYREAGNWRRQLMAKKISPAEVAKGIEARAANLASHQMDNIHVPRSMREVADRFHVLHDIEHNTPGMRTQYVPLSGMPGFNYYLGGGAHMKNIITVAARAKTGKTSFLITIAILMALDGQHVGYFDNEMTEEEFYTRMLAWFSGVKEEDILSHKYRNDSSSWHAVQKARGEVSRIFDYFHYIPTQGDPPEVVASKIAKFYSEHVGYDTFVSRGTEHRVTRKCLVIYDWIKLDSDSVSSNWGEHQALGELLTTFKKVITRHNLPMICGAQTKQEMVKMHSAQQRAQVAGASVSMSDRINWFSSTICELAPLSEEEAEAVGTTFARRTWTDAYDRQIEGLDLRFNQIMQISLNRKGRKCTYGLPFWHFLGRYRYYDMYCAETADFLRDRWKQRKLGPKRTVGRHSGGVLGAAPSNPPANLAQAGLGGAV